MAIRSGTDYINGLMDGREVWSSGRRIEDVTTHPGFTGTIRTLATLYDKQHEKKFADIMTLIYNGEHISYSYLPPLTPEQLSLKRRNIEFWSEQTLGQMGRFPEFCAELIVGLFDFASILDLHNKEWGANARAYYRYCSSHDLCLTHALTDQFYDRSKRASEQDNPDQMLHVVSENSQGAIVRGLRAFATLAPLSDEVLVYPNRPRDADEADYAVAFALPMNAPGLKIICRDLYAEHADPERYPLTSRFDEVDATLIFDNVLVPWNRFFVYRDPDLATAFHGIHFLAHYSTLVRLIIKLETFLGAAQLLTQWSGRQMNLPSQIQLSSLIQDIQVLRACVRDSEANAFKTQGGTLCPLISPGYRVHSIDSSDRAERTLENLLTSSLVLSGGASDLANREIGNMIDNYFRAAAPTTKEHLRLLALAADLVMSPFGKRSQLYERLQSGEPDRMRIRIYNQFKDSILKDRLLTFLKEWDEHHN